jgi:hypothetical protein
MNSAIGLYTMVPRTGGCAYDVGVWVGIRPSFMGTIFCRAVPNLSVTIRIFVGLLYLLGVAAAGAEGRVRQRVLAAQALLQLAAIRRHLQRRLLEFGSHRQGHLCMCGRPCQRFAASTGSETLGGKGVCKG